METQNKPKRTLVIGDIHGGLRSLKQVLERASYDINNDKLIFLGDYVDGWSESAELVQFLIELKDASTYSPIFIIGNHDMWCKEWLIKGQCPNIWVQQGGQATIDSYIRTGYLASDAHRQFFANLLNYYIDEENRGFVHGGFISGKGLGHEMYQADYYWDRDLWSLAVMSHNRIHEGPDRHNSKIRRFEKHLEVYVGHTTTNNWDCKPHYPEYQDPNQIQNGPITVPMTRCNVTNMDTGGGFRGKVTALDINTKEYFQSDYVHFLYSDERGR